MQKVCRAIKRVDDPAAGWVLPFDLGALFAQETIGRTRFHEFFANNLLRVQISACHKIARPFDADLELFDLSKILQKRAARFSGSFYHYVKIGTALHGSTPIKLKPRL